MFSAIFENNVNIKHYSRNSSFRGVFAERFNRSIRDLLKKPVFEKKYAIWIDVLPTITKQYTNRVNTSTELTPAQTSLKNNKGSVYKKILDKRKKIKPKFQVNDLVRIADLKMTFSKGHTTIWSYKIYENSEIINDAKPSYRIVNLIERFSEPFLKRTELTMKENDCVMEKTKDHLHQIEMSLSITWYANQFIG